MGKHCRDPRCTFPLENSHPGCALNILHIIRYHHWRYVKRRYITSKRNASSRHVAGVRNPGNDTNGSSDDKMQECGGSEKDYCIIGEKMTESIPAPKNSVKARIKALISEEMSKKKGKHHRSSSYPVRSQLTRSDSIHHLAPSDTDPHVGFIVDNGSPANVQKTHEHTSSISTLDSLPPECFEDPDIGDKSYEESGTIFTGQLLEPNQVDEYEEQPTENQTLLEEKLVNKKQDTSELKLIHAKELTRKASLRTKKFLDALDLGSASKSLLLQILEDPSSPLAPHFHNQHALNQKMRLYKSGSFPSPGLSGRRRSGRSKPKHTQEEIGFHAKEKGGQSLTSGEFRYSGDLANQSMRYRAKNEVDGIPKPNTKPADMRENQMAIKRFRDLRKKIKHVIKESRKERHRITMDAILHKIPHGHGFPTELKKDDFNQLKDPAMNKQGNANLGSTDGMRRMRRTSSLNESMDRYCQLYETTLNKESKNQTSERSTLKAEETSLPPGSVEKPLTRVLSLPTLTSYIYQSRDSSDIYSSGMMTSTVLDGPANTGSNFDERISVDLPTDSESQSEIQENLTGVGQNSSVIGEVGLASVAKNEENDNVGNLTAGQINSRHEDIVGYIIRPPKESMAELEEAIPVSLTDSTNPGQFSVPEDSEEKDGLPDRQDNLAEGEVERDKVELQNNLSGYEILDFQADAKDKAEFAFVSDVLQLYGLRGDESPGTWHCDDHPSGPLAYEEVEGCLLLHPDCTRNEACGNFNHLLLFDLINEVLMDIYRRSYSYYPKRLSSLSHIRPMPAGRHVLKEVWAFISSYLSTRPEVDQSIDYAVSQDLATNDGWMNLQFDIECAGLELEDLILDDLLEEVFGT